MDWISNPELVRHLRSELRTRRMGIAFAITWLLCCLLVLTFYQTYHEDKMPYPHEYFVNFYVITISVEALVLGLWCLAACSQGIANERNQRTFDFVRTTRLTSAELMLGMIFGFPAMAYFIVACAVPFTLAAGLLSHFSLLAIALTYLMILLVCVVLALAGLAVSMMTEKPRSAELLLLLMIFGSPWIVMLVAEGGTTPMGALVSLAVVPGLLPLYHLPRFADLPPTASFFGVQTPLLLISIILYASFGAWLVVALVRNLKKDPEDMRLLSRVQGVAFAAYLNLLLFAVVDVRVVRDQAETPDWAVYYLAVAFLVVNYALLYAVGLSMLSSAQRLKSWWLRAGGSLRRYWLDDGPPWLWMAASAGAAFLIFEAAALASSRIIPFSQWSVPIVRLLVILAHVTKDILFLQWCMLTRFKRPVNKGILLLVLYYFTVFVLIAIFPAGDDAKEAAFAFFSPLGVLEGKQFVASLVGAGFQVALSVLLLRGIELRVARPARIGAVVTGD